MRLISLTIWTSNNMKRNQVTALNCSKASNDENFYSPGIAPRKKKRVYNCKKSRSSFRQECSQSDSCYQKHCGKQKRQIMLVGMSYTYLATFNFLIQSKR